MQLTDDSHVNKSLRLHNVGASLVLDMRHSRDVRDLDKAISIF